MRPGAAARPRARPRPPRGCGEYDAARGPEPPAALRSERPTARRTRGCQPPPAPPADGATCGGRHA
eukprot:175661-Chlamydomonas_euryale.AAC.3